MNLEHRTEALLAMVRQYQQQGCEQLLAPARADARAQVKAALSEARRRVRTAIGEERKRWSVQIGAAEAALATDRRLTEQRHAALLLAAAWQVLRNRMLAQWRDPVNRMQWLDAHLRRALQCVPHAGGWRIEHAPDLAADERVQAEQRLRAAHLDRVQFEAAPDIAAGFRVINGHNELDATLDGLLADRAALEGRLLHYLADPDGEAVQPVAEEALS